MDQGTRNILGLCKDIEESCAGIYFHYAEIFAEIPEARNLWEKAAFEEKNHANLLKMALNCRDLKLGVEATDLFRYRNVANMVRSILDDLRRVSPTLEDALRSSISLEKKLSEFHLDFVARFENESEGRLFCQLAKADADHVADLENAYRELIDRQKSKPPAVASEA